MENKSSHIDVIVKLFEEYGKLVDATGIKDGIERSDANIKIIDTKSLDKAVKIVEGLCMSPVYKIDDKFNVFIVLIKYDAKYELNVSTDILSRWRDGLQYLRGDPMNQMIELLVKVVESPIVSSHERVFTAVSLYNNGYITICYPCFEFLAGDSMLEIHHRIDAIKFLFASEDYRETSLRILLEITNDEKYSDEIRYQAISAFMSKKGIRTFFNGDKLKILYDEEFAYQLQKSFFYSDKNATKYRILSGQCLLQMTTISNDEKVNVINTLFMFTSIEYVENTRADAADVVLRLGNSFEKAQARQIITDMGFSSDGNTRKRITPKTIYDNSQNVHNETIDECVQLYLEKIITTIKCTKSFENVKDEISSYIRKTVTDAYKRNAAYQALNRINIDTATFTSFNVTLSDILIHVWTRINSDEFSHCSQQLPLPTSEVIAEELTKRLVEELTDMDDTCSSGHAARFVNVLSTVDDTLRISWLDQLRANVKGRLNACIRDCPDNDLQASLALGMIEEADKEDRDVYMKFIKDSFVNVELQLHKEFVDEGYIKDIEFIEYMIGIKKEWLV